VVLFDFVDFEGPTQGATQFFGIGCVDVHGFVVSLESEVRSGEVVLAGNVDGGRHSGYVRFTPASPCAAVSR
jgi:hypothetical protein